MINYSDLATKLLVIASRNHSTATVAFDTDVDAINKPTFIAPAMIISPMTAQLGTSALVQYSFQLLYLDHLTEEGTNYSDVLEVSLQNLIGFVEIVDLDYKVIKPMSFEAVLVGYDGGMLAGHQCTLIIEDQFNLDKYKSVYYE